MWVIEKTVFLHRFLMVKHEFGLAENCFQQITFRAETAVKGQPRIVLTKIKLHD